MAAFEQSLSNMTHRLQNLTLTAEQKVNMFDFNIFCCCYHYIYYSETQYYLGYYASSSSIHEIRYYTNINIHSFVKGVQSTHRQTSNCVNFLKYFLHLSSKHTLSSLCILIIIFSFYFKYHSKDSFLMPMKEAEKKIHYTNTYIVVVVLYCTLHATAL